MSSFKDDEAGWLAGDYGISDAAFTPTSSHHNRLIITPSPNGSVTQFANS